MAIPVSSKDDVYPTFKPFPISIISSFDSIASSTNSEISDLRIGTSPALIAIPAMLLKCSMRLLEHHIRDVIP